MDLWIRSQDKLLLTKIDYILVNDLDIFNQNQLIGTYSSYERALEVLDEIQEHLEKIGKDEILTDKIGIMNGIKHYGIVYKMPEE